jgi:hypothetical protein
VDESIREGSNTAKMPVGPNVYQFLISLRVAKSTALHRRMAVTGTHRLASSSQLVIYRKVIIEKIQTEDARLV